MKTESNIQPLPFCIEQHGERAEIVLRENITSVVEEDGTIMYTYEEYRLMVPYRDNLYASVEGNFAGWLSVAKVAENKG